MKEGLQKYTWLIALILYSLVLLGGGIYLYHINQLKAFFDVGWPIGLLLFIFLWLFIVTYLYHKNRLSELKLKWYEAIPHFIKIRNWLISGTLLATIVLSIGLSFASSFLYDALFPSAEEKILKNTEALVAGQEVTKIEISETSKKIDELLKKANLDPRDVEKYLKELPIKEGENKAKARIDEWYEKRKISPVQKELLFVAISAIYQYNKELTAEIEKLKTKGKTELALFLEKIQNYFNEGNAAKIRDEYLLIEKQIEAEAKQKKIKALKESIKATQALFAIEETKDLYLKLIVLEPTAINHHNFALFLHNNNSFNEAGYYYENAITKYREKAKINPDSFSPNLANTLNNLGLLHADKNELTLAQQAYKEALTIRRKLADQNPHAFLPDLATSLNNLGVLHADNNELGLAHDAFQKALDIYKKLADQNPHAFLPDLAMTLNNLGALQKVKNELTLAQQTYHEALTIRRKLADQNPHAFLPDLEQFGDFA